MTKKSSKRPWNVPPRLSRLPELACNLLWSWRPESRDLFRRLDSELWEKTEHNPVRLLDETENLFAAAEDAAFVAAYHEAVGDLDKYLNRQNTWTNHVYPAARESGGVAYFSAEFGLHESVPVYSGGLGVLAGDHVKSASDLGFPLVAVGLLYAQGYFRQRLDASGQQSEVYEPFDPDSRPLSPALDEFGREVTVTVNLPGREVRLKVWRIEVGRVPVLLLDANVPQNSEADRDLTSRLYGGDSRTRISQEIVLGIGGVRALKRMGLTPAVYHMNEGHAAFLSVERMRELVNVGRTFDEAREEVQTSTVFTTHTPVPAGHDAFPGDLFWEFMTGWPEAIGTTGHDFWRLGSKEGDDRFNMTVLAMNLSRTTNAVSAIHGEVSTEMFGRRITHITNGVHTWSWLSSEMFALFNRNSLGRAWREAPETPSAWSFVEELPAQELWETHARTKRKMTTFINARLGLQAARSGGKEQTLDPDALIIGFARRFATYKRATLLLSDPERLKRITNGADRPVQFVFAGKAHPADQPGKAFLKELYGAPEETNIIVLEDYDMNIARHLVQGVDVWMNNPRRPLEASGTSGQKASLNGIPNLSVLDGWWPEAYNGRNGWAIGEEREFASEAEQDAEDVASLYSILEDELVPLYYRRDASGISEGWTDVMKEAITTVGPVFSTQRMVQDYVHKLYSPGLTVR
ncbi:alpha-glucan family phosphorylase [Rubrobacter indicoceani]|uniref:alpha-glucan family phosphorylase n=1 Tax=Rubrobacter indicoceani TaxID=2051957 RepID=UPI000E5AD57F|nr:alpha-glucan family phosphorylase [Rubrobacter indicoceani]